jgi:hypothetical protein
LATSKILNWAATRDFSLASALLASTLLTSLSHWPLMGPASALLNQMNSSRRLARNSLLAGWTLMVSGEPSKTWAPSSGICPVEKLSGEEAPALLEEERPLQNLRLDLTRLFQGAPPLFAHDYELLNGCDCCLPNGYGCDSPTCYGSDKGCGYSLTLQKMPGHVLQYVHVSH